MGAAGGFGPAPLPGGGVRFRLWAPGAAGGGVRVRLGDGGGALEMTAAGGGWLEADAPAAGPGTEYGFVLGDGTEVPDPAARRQPRGVRGPSQVVDPGAYRWRHPGWSGRPWHEVALYELHVGTFSPEGTFAGAAARLPFLKELGVTAVELMPVAQMPGDRGWGYDGVLLWAPHHAYGTPDDLKALIDGAHGHGLAVFLDVVYNHFGPEGNYLPKYCPAFFREDVRTPWGAAIDYRVPEVREFAIGNALHWLGEFRADGLRLDAVHAISSAGEPHLLDELAARVRAAFPGRHVHLVLENEHNEARRLRPAGPYDAQWNDDWHHGAHVLATGEAEAYYSAYADRPVERLARSMAEGFAYQGEPFPIREDRAPRGEPSGGLPPTPFVNFLQNHDQVGNRAAGERLSVLAPPRAVEVLTALLILSPQIPMLWMGEEWGTERPFLFFCDFEGELALAVREGRRREFKAFKAFADPEVRARIPDPNAPSTFEASKLDWAEPGQQPHAARLALVRRLLEIRHRHVVPALAGAPGGGGSARVLAPHGIEASWRLGGGAGLAALANLGDAPLAGLARPEGAALLFAWPDEAATAIVGGALPGWSAAFFLRPGEAGA